MITLHELVVDSDRFADFEVKDEAALDLFIDGFDTASMAATWPTPAIRKSDAALRTAAPLPDFASVFGAVPVLSAGAVRALGERLDEVGELLPLQSDVAEYWALNVTSVADVMDEEKSSGDWFAPDRLMNLRNLVVRQPPPMALPLIFKLPQWRKGRALVTDEFMNVVSAHGLTGLAARRLTGR